MYHLAYGRKVNNFKVMDDQGFFSFEYIFQSKAANKLLHSENYSLRSQFSGEQGVMFIRKISVYLQMILLLVFSSLVNSAESVP